MPGRAGQEAGQITQNAQEDVSHHAAPHTDPLENAATVLAGLDLFGFNYPPSFAIAPLGCGHAASTHRPQQPAQ